MEADNMEEIRIRKREEIPVEDTWALEDLYATDAKWEEDFKHLAEFSAWAASVIAWIISILLILNAPIE